MSDSEDKALQLVGMAYDAALDESKWTSFLDAFAAAVGGSSALLRSNDISTKSASFNASVGYEPVWQAAYCNHFVKLDYYDNVMNQYAPGTIISSTRHVDQTESYRNRHCVYKY
jgi:hypothetical protein